MNDYMQVRFDVEPCSEMATDVLAAVLAEIGYESFVPDERGVTAFVPQGKYDEIRLKEELSQYPIGGVSSDIRCREGLERRMGEKLFQTYCRG